MCQRISTLVQTWTLEINEESFLLSLQYFPYEYKIVPEEPETGCVSWGADKDFETSFPNKPALFSDGPCLNALLHVLRALSSGCSRL
jgi:hypothetical protein